MTGTETHKRTTEGKQEEREDEKKKNEERGRKDTGVRVGTDFVVSRTGFQYRTGDPQEGCEREICSPFRKSPWLLEPR